MPSIQDILNVLPGYSASRDQFNQLVHGTPADQARAMTLRALNAATMIGPGKMPMPEVAPEVTAPEAVPLPSSGARWGKASDPSNRDSFTSIKIPAMLAAILGYGAANKNGGQQ
jgi:hypothetical protein